MKPRILTYFYSTVMGKHYHSSVLPFLSKDQQTTMDEIGYGKHDEFKNFEDYLNTQGLGTFKVIQTHYDNGDFQEKFIIIRVLNLIGHFTNEERKVLRGQPKQ